MRKQIRHRLADTGESFQAFVERLIAAELTKDSAGALAIQPQKLAAQVSQNLVRREKNDLPDNPAASLPGAGTASTVTIQAAVLDRIAELAEEIAEYAKSRHGDPDQEVEEGIREARGAADLAEGAGRGLEKINAVGEALPPGRAKSGKRKAAQ